MVTLPRVSLQVELPVQHEKSPGYHYMVNLKKATSDGQGHHCDNVTFNRISLLSMSALQQKLSSQSARMHG